MANYRQIHTCIWKDAWFFDLEADHKLLWIYLFSNERANLTGLYDLHKRIITFETGLSPKSVDSGFATFAQAGKAVYEDGWVWIPNLAKYNVGSLNSDKIRTHIVGALSKIADTPLKARCIDYYNGIVDEEYRIDTLSIPYATGYQEQEQEQEQEPHGDETSPSEPEPIKRKPSLKNEIRAELEIHFAEATGLSRPKTGTQTQKRSAGTLWWTPLREIAELCEWDGPRAAKLIDATVAHLKTSGMTIASPKSIVLTARAVIADNVPGVRMPRAGPRTQTVRIWDKPTEQWIETEAIR